jgi:6-pyruvoyltetrahydropterin/6-carboxytetrahydropterin synthase
MADYSVRVSKDYLVFSAAHFITYCGECERLHGHNYRVTATLDGSLGEDQYVYDFVALKALLKRIIGELDHRTLLPARSPRISLAVEGEVVEVRTEGRRYVFPLSDCVLLPIENTTAEQLAAWIASQAIGELHRSGARLLTAITIEVEESFGQSATYRQSLS